jgi:hypothetical protein
MLRNLRVVLSAFALGAFVLFSSSATLAGTIIKLNLGGVGPDVGMNAGGVLSTVDDTPPGPLGDQFTAVEYTDFLSPISNITTNTASFSLNGLVAAGAAQSCGCFGVQNISGGILSL